MGQKRELEIHRDTVYEVRRKLRRHAENLGMHWRAAEQVQIRKEVEEIDRELTRLGEHLEEIERELLRACEQAEEGLHT